MRAKLYTFIILIFAISVSCGSKKNISKTQKKENAKIELKDNSQINTKIENEKQFINVNTKERIVTFYGVRLVPVKVGGETVHIPLSYPERTETDRDISQQIQSDRMQIIDSTRLSVEMYYKNTLLEKEQEISELKESTIIYQIAILIASIVMLALLVAYILIRIKVKKLVL